MKNLQEKISDEVKSKRHGLRISQEDLAEKVDKTASFIGQLERGECSLNVETLQRLVHYLGIDANALLAADDISPNKVYELCNIANGLDDQKLALLIAFSKLLQQIDL